MRVLGSQLCRLTAFVAIALAAVACGAVEHPPVADPSTTVDTTGALTPTSAPTDDQPIGDPEATNLADFFGWEEGTDAATARIREQEMRREELLRACMAGHGFVYHPIAYDDDDYVGLYDTGVDRAARVGYGITPSPEGVLDPWVDPNEEARAAMSVAEEEAWLAALWGTESEREAAEQTYGNAGCVGEVDDALSEELERSVWPSIGLDAEEMHQAILADRRLVDAERVWAACMADAGHAVTTITEWTRRVADEIRGELAPLYGTIEARGSEHDAEIARITREEGELAATRYRRTLPPVDLSPIVADLEALRDREIELAVLDFGCQEGYAEAYRTVQSEIEEAFIAENRAELTRMLEELQP